MEAVAEPSSVESEMGLPFKLEKTLAAPSIRDHYDTVRMEF